MRQWTGMSPKWKHLRNSFGKWIYGKLESDSQMLVEPHDSISNVSKESKKSCSKQTRQSATSSSTSSAHLKIAPERTALQAHMSALKEKHVVEMEKTDYMLNQSEWN